MEHSPDIVILAKDHTGRLIRCGWNNGSVYLATTPVPLSVPIQVWYFDQRDEEYAHAIRQEIAIHKESRLVYDAEAKETVERRVDCELYLKVEVGFRTPKDKEQFEFFRFERSEISRPRCPGCCLQGSVIMPDDGFPKNKQFYVKKQGFTEINVKGKPVVKKVWRRDSEPYCYRCRGRLSLIMKRQVFDVPLLTDEQLMANGVDIIGRRNDELVVS